MIHDLKSFSKAFALTLAVFFAAASSAFGQTCPDPADIIQDLDGALAHVRYLADDRLEGRAVGSFGARCAADYIAAEFSALGLEPALASESRRTRVVNSRT